MSPPLLKGRFCKVQNFVLVIFFSLHFKHFTPVFSCFFGFWRCCGCNSYLCSFIGKMVSLLGLCRNFSFPLIFCSLKTTCYGVVSWSIYPAWHSLSILDLWLVSDINLVKLLVIIASNYYFIPFFSLCYSYCAHLTVE